MSELSQVDMETAPRPVEEHAVFSIGDIVKVRRSDGSIEPGWEVVDHKVSRHGHGGIKMSITVYKEIDGVPYEKTISRKDLYDANPELAPSVDTERTEKIGGEGLEAAAGIEDPSEVGSALPEAGIAEKVMGGVEKPTLTPQEELDELIKGLTPEEINQLRGYAGAIEAMQDIHAASRRGEQVDGRDAQYWQQQKGQIARELESSARLRGKKEAYVRLSKLVQ